jgi:hypothetical protein
MSPSLLRVADLHVAAGRGWAQLSQLPIYRRERLSQLRVCFQTAAHAAKSSGSVSPQPAAAAGRQRARAAAGPSAGGADQRPPQLVVLRGRPLRGLLAGRERARTAPEAGAARAALSASSAAIARSWTLPLGTGAASGGAAARLSARADCRTTVYLGKHQRWDRQARRQQRHGHRRHRGELRC